MSDGFNKESMLDVFIYETLQLTEKMEEEIIAREKSGGVQAAINEIFRVMHTIKGSAAMMEFNEITHLAHAVEDLFFYLREEKPDNINDSKIIDLVLESIDFIKNEIVKMQNGQAAEGSAATLIAKVTAYLGELQPAAGAPLPAVAKKHGTKAGGRSSGKGGLVGESRQIPAYQAVIFFEPDCDYENLRAYTVYNNLKKEVSGIEYYPEDLTDEAESLAFIRNEGFKICFKSDLSQPKLLEMLQKNAFVTEVRLETLMEETPPAPSRAKKNRIILDEADEKDAGDHEPEKKPDQEAKPNGNFHAPIKNSLTSVSLNKLDILMDLVGELVIAEAMVTRHPELEGLPLDNFYKAVRQLRKITKELQDVVMSIRMVPLAQIFQKMQRIVRDMSVKLQKEVELEIIGEETEVDKNIIEQISDPLMHLIRNAIDHGLEPAIDRKNKGKSEIGKVTLEAKNNGGDVLIAIKDDGRGLNREKISEKARGLGLVTKPETELSDKEVFKFILVPGFSTKAQVSEFSGRGVGMDVVVKNLEKVRGTVLIDSVPDQGTAITLKIPLTLAIIDGITVKVGASQYTVPTTSIRESFRGDAKELIRDPEGNEMILIRGNCYPVIKLYERFKIANAVIGIDQGVIIMVENNDKICCLFVDELMGEQQVVVKPLPEYIKKTWGIAGCTLLGNGSISLILDIAGFTE